MTARTTRVISVLAAVMLCSVGIPAVFALEPLWTYPAGSSELSGVDITADGGTIIVAAGKLWVFNRAGSLIQKEPYGEMIAVTPDGKSAMSAYSSTVYYYHLQATDVPGERKLVKSWELPNNEPVRSISLSDDGNMSTAALRGMTVLVIDPWEKAAYPNNQNVTKAFQVSADGSYIAALSLEQIRLFSVQGEEAVMSPISTSTDPTIMALSGNGLIAAFNDQNKIRCVNTIDGNQLWNASGSGTVVSLVMPPSDSVVISGTDTGNVYSYDMKGNLQWMYATNPQMNQLSSIEDIAVSSTAASVAVVTRDGKFIILDSNGAAIGSAKLDDRLRHVALSQDSSVAVATGDKGIYAFAASPTAITTLETTPVETGYGETAPTFAPLETFTQALTITDSPTATAITAIPTEYSVIRKTESPVPAVIPALAVIIVLFLACNRIRNR